MNKGVVCLIIAIIIIVVAIAGFAVYKNSNSNENNDIGEVTKNNEQEKNIINEENVNLAGTENTANKVLVVYYSAQSHTKAVAEKIADNLSADIFEIVPEEKYTSEDLNWNNSNSRVSREHNDESLRDVKLENTKVNNWEDYDTVLIGYPIWWGVAAWPVNTFVKSNDFTGKTVIPFCTSVSSGIGNSAKLLEDLTKTGNWENGHRFSSGASSNDIKAWTDSLK